MRLIALACLLIGCGASPNAGPHAHQSSFTTSRVFSGAENDGTRCRSEAPTGTHLERRVCRTQAERDEDLRNARDLYYDPDHTLRPHPHGI